MQVSGAVLASQLCIKLTPAVHVLCHNVYIGAIERSPKYLMTVVALKDCGGRQQHMLSTPLTVRVIHSLQNSKLCHEVLLSILCL